MMVSVAWCVYALCTVERMWVGAKYGRWADGVRLNARIQCIQLGMRCLCASLHGISLLWAFSVLRCNWTRPTVEFLVWALGPSSATAIERLHLCIALRAPKCSGRWYKIVNLIATWKTIHRHKVGFASNICCWVAARRWGLHWGWMWMPFICAKDMLSRWL